jgi:hypothetical protein
MMNLPEQIRAELPLGWSVSSGTSFNPIDLELTERMFNITAQLDSTGTQYVFPWQIHLVKGQLRTGEFGTPAAGVYKVEGSCDDYRRIQTPPMCAKEIPTFVEASRVKENQALLRFGRDSNWPLKITFATTASPTSTLAITYDITWEGIESTEEGEISTNWCWDKFMEKVRFENLTAPPAFMRQGVVWNTLVRKENNSIRIVLKEEGIWTPEDPDGPIAILKIRSTLLREAALAEMFQVLKVLYQGRYSVTEEVPSREWAIVGTYGDWVAPEQYRLEPPQASPQDMASLNGAILDAALKTQNYDKGLNKYVRKFNPEEESSAVVVVESGRQGDHGWAVAFKQGPYRCLLLDTTDGLSEEETLWVALSAWATFQPRLTMPRQFSGKLYYPDAASHVFGECWQHLDDLSAMPSFYSKSPICQAAMLALSEGLSHLTCGSTWFPQPTAEAPEKLAKIANNAAISRVRPLADGPNQWDIHRSSVATVCQSSLGLPGTG